MNHKNCKHYNEIIQVLSRNLCLEDVNDVIENTVGCECIDEKFLVCKLRAKLAEKLDTATTLNLNKKDAEKLIDNLNKQMNEVADTKSTNIVYKDVPIKERESGLVSKTNWYKELPIDKQKLIDKLTLIGDVKYIRSEDYIQEQIFNAISEMDIYSLETHLNSISNFDKKEEFLAEINFEFKKFEEKKDTFLIPYNGKCSGRSCGNFGNNGKSFTGNISNTFFNVVVEKENNQCVGICKCYKFTVDDEILNKTRLEADIEKMNGYNFTDSDLDNLPF